MITYQEIIEGIETLPIEEQDNLFELIRKRRIEQRRTEIVANARQILQSVEMGTAKTFTNFDDLKSYLLADDDE
jgi:hypothetical protein